MKHIFYFFLCLALATSCFKKDDESNSGGGPSYDTELSAAQTDQGVSALNELFAESNQDPSASLAFAYESFDSAIRNDPNNGTARIMMSQTMLPVFFDDPESATQPPAGTGGSSTLTQLLNQFGIGTENRSLTALGLGLSPTAPDELPTTAPFTGEVQDWLANDVVLGLFDDAANHLEAVGASYSDSITLNNETFEVDYGDAQILAAQIRLLQAYLLVYLAFDYDYDTYFVHGPNAEVFYPASDGTYTGPAWDYGFTYRLETGLKGRPSWLSDQWDTDGAVQYYENWEYNWLSLGSSPRPGFINHANTGAHNFLDTVWQGSGSDRLKQARSYIITGIDNFIRGTNSIMAETDNQYDDLLVIEGEEACGMTALLDWLGDIAAGLSTGGAFTVDTQFAPNCVVYDGFNADARMLDSATYRGRPFFPDYGLGLEVVQVGIPDAPLEIDALLATPSSFANPTLGGVYPEFTAYEMAEFWQALNETFEMIYCPGWTRGNRAFSTTHPSLHDELYWPDWGEYWGGYY